MKLKMKKHLLLFSLMLILSVTFGQTKPKSKEKPPTQKGMDDAMKEAQKALDEMSPEEIKMMKESGIEIPNFKNVPKVSNKQLADAWEDENRIVPPKDVARITSISKIPLTSQTINSFLQNTHKNVASCFDASEKKIYEEAMQFIKNKNSSSIALGNASVQLWMLGKPAAAVYIMGKVCIENPFDTDNLNNYAAFLTMCGGEQFSIPILNYLNQQFPKNSTILNNIAQAWFGLGDIDKAGKYIDSTLFLYALHPQANMTKSRIKEENGKKAEAIAAVKKSIQKYYSSEKEDRLRKLGHKLESKDIDWPFPKKYDGFGLGNFTHPPIPKTVEQCIELEPVWYEFKKSCAEESEKLGQQLKSAMAAADKRTQKIASDANNLVKTSQQNGRIMGPLTVLPFYAKKASLKLNENLDAYGKKTMEIAKKWADDMTNTGVPAKQQYDIDMEKIAEEDLEQTGEGLPNKDFCPRKVERTNQYLGIANNITEEMYTKNLENTKKFLTENIEWYMYMQWPEQFEVTKLEYKIAWLKGLSDVTFESVTTFKCVKKEKKSNNKLSNFNDIHCEYHSELNLGYGKMVSDCDKMTTTLDIDVMGLELFKSELKQDFGDNKNTFSDQFVSCTIEAGVKKSVGVDKGPIKLEGEVGVSGFIEIDRNGISDAGVVIKGSVKAGTNVSGEGGSEHPNMDVTLIGTEVKIGVNSGIKAEGQGILSLLNPDKK